MRNSRLSQRYEYAECHICTYILIPTTQVKPDVCTVVTELGDTIALYYYVSQAICFASSSLFVCILKCAIYAF